MESDGEDLDIFEEHENDTGADNIENEQTTDGTSAAVKIAPPKRVVKNPRLKFNPERLCGERGIPILVDHFKNVKFKGVGHEKEDLDMLLSKLEHWTHRLFPSMKFEDCLNHIEKLGKKRPVQTCVRKIRLDMPIQSSDFIKDDDDDDVQRNDDPEPEEVDAFDRLIGESQDVQNSNLSITENAPDSSSFYSSPIPDNTQGHVLGSSFGSSLTEEQKERMERNKMLAAERRKARLAALQQNSAESHTTNHEITPSQNISIVPNPFDKLFDSSSSNQENMQNTDNNSVMEISHDISETLKEPLSESHNENSENLELDDLMELVNEEEPAADKNSDEMSSDQLETVSSGVNESDKISKNDVVEISCSDIVQKDHVSISYEPDNKSASSLKTPETEDEENLGIESLLDLVNENSEDRQEDSSNSSCIVKDTTVHDIGKETDSSKEFNTMDCEEK